MKIFISYSWKNSAERAVIVNELNMMINCEVVFDKKNINFGEEIHKSIDELLRQCDCVIVFITKESKNSYEIRDELTIARTLKKLIIPIVEKDLSVEDKDLPWFLRDINQIRYNNTEFDEVIKKIKDTIKKHLTKEKQLIKSTDFNESENDDIQLLAGKDKMSELLKKYLVSENIAVKDNYAFPNELRQTLIQSGSVKPEADIILNYLSLEVDNRPYIERLIVISRPLDINFAAHSLSVEEEYGMENIKLTVVFEENLTLPSFPNFTLAQFQTPPNYLTLLTLPFVRKRNYLEPAEDHTSGIVFFDKRVFDSIHNYLKKMRNTYENKEHYNRWQELDNAKKYFWDIDRRTYLEAIAISISDAIQFNKNLLQAIKYIGVVGSVTQKLEKEHPSDLDFLIVLDRDEDSIEVNYFNLLRATIRAVLNRYSINDRIIFKDIWEANPAIIYVEKAKDKRTFPIQILLNTKNTANKWSKFISRHRFLNNYNLFEKYPRDIIVSEFRINNFLDEPHGLKSLKNSIFNNKVEDVIWTKSFDKYIRKPISVTLKNGSVLLSFLRYSVKWSIINFYEAEDSKLHKAGNLISESDITNLLNYINLENKYNKIIIGLYFKKDIDTNNISEIKEIVLQFISKLVDYCSNDNYS